MFDGLRAAETDIHFQNDIWSRFSSDKSDIGAQLATVLGKLIRESDANDNLSALSIGCGKEPQFRLLQAFCRDHLYLLDKDETLLTNLRERVKRQSIGNVTLSHRDFHILLDAGHCADYRKLVLGGRKLNLVLLHHSMYYLLQDQWLALIENIYSELLLDGGYIHCVLMASDSGKENSTTTLYNDVARRYFSHINDQDLRVLPNLLRTRSVCRQATFELRRTEVQFSNREFYEFMAVIWMILLYPDVHQYTPQQMREITMHVHELFFLRKFPLIQEQDHLVIRKA